MQDPEPEHKAAAPEHAAQDEAELLEAAEEEVDNGGRPQRMRRPPTRLTYDEPGIPQTVYINSAAYHCLPQTGAAIQQPQASWSLWPPTQQFMQHQQSGWFPWQHAQQHRQPGWFPWQPSGVLMMYPDDDDALPILCDVRRNAGVLKTLQRGTFTNYILSFYSFIKKTVLMNTELFVLWDIDARTSCLVIFSLQSHSSIAGAGQ